MNMKTNQRKKTHRQNENFIEKKTSERERELINEFYRITSDKY